MEMVEFLETPLTPTTGALWHTGDDTFTPSAVALKWAEVQNFDNPEHPVNNEDVDMRVSMLLRLSGDLADTYLGLDAQG